MKVPRLLLTSKIHKGIDMNEIILDGEPIKLHDLVNQLNNEQIVELLRIIFHNRPTEVFVGMYPKGIMRSADLDQEIPVCLNGTMIQINTEYSFTEEAIAWEFMDLPRTEVSDE